MELHQLRYFVAVAQTGSFSRAAVQCHVSQPSLSQQIAKLEKQLNRKLFDRLNRRVTLTDAGRVLLNQAGTILSAVEDAEKRLRDDGDFQDARLTVGAIPTIAPYLLPSTLQQFSQSFPDVELMVHEDVTAHLIAALVAGEVDVALMALPIDDERIEIETLFVEPLWLALPFGHALSERKRITAQHLYNEKFIVLGDMHCLGEQVLSFCRTNNCGPRIGCRSAQIATIEQLIIAGHGISLLPEMALPKSVLKSTPEQRKDSPIYRELSEAPPTRTIVAAWHRHRYLSSAAQRFVEQLREIQATKNQTAKDQIAKNRLGSTPAKTKRGAGK